MLTPEEQAELESLRTELDGLGGRGVDIANRIDALEKKGRTFFEQAIHEYGANIHGHNEYYDDTPLEEIVNLDPNANYLLVQENVHGGYWLSTHDDRDDAYRYHINDEYAEEWDWVALIDLETGKSHHPKRIEVTEWEES